MASRQRERTHGFLITLIGTFCTLLAFFFVPYGTMVTSNPTAAGPTLTMFQFLQHINYPLDAPVAWLGLLLTALVTTMAALGLTNNIPSPAAMIRVGGMPIGALLLLFLATIGLLTYIILLIEPTIFLYAFISPFVPPLIGAWLCALGMLIATGGSFLVLYQYTSFPFQREQASEQSFSTAVAIRVENHSQVIQSPSTVSPTPPTQHNPNNVGNIQTTTVLPQSQQLNEQATSPVPITRIQTWQPQE